MSFVLDASVVLSWAFVDEHTPSSLSVLESLGTTHAWVHALWRYEVANGLVMAQRRNRIDDAYREEFFAKLSRFDIRRDEDSATNAWNSTLALAQTHRLTIYDAAYLELAMRKNLPLATMDAALAKAAKSEKIKVLG